MNIVGKKYQTSYINLYVSFLRKLTLFFGSRPGFKLSDASFHLAGDGQLAGIYEPHPQKVFKFHHELYNLQ